ncbi:MAG: hypothetical protein EXS31_09275 [Pedosphaera sp.]|nr:hypothetical protein [Pedosphaera sp.]
MNAARASEAPTQDAPFGSSRRLPPCYSTRGAILFRHEHAGNLDRGNQASARARAARSLALLLFITRQRVEDALADVLPSRDVEQEVLDILDAK